MLNSIRDKLRDALQRAGIYLSSQWHKFRTQPGEVGLSEPSTDAVDITATMSPVEFDAQLRTVAAREHSIAPLPGHTYERSSTAKAWRLVFPSP